MSWGAEPAPRRWALPDRAPDAVPASVLLSGIRDATLDDREARIVKEVLAGNVPSWLRNLVPLRLANPPGHDREIVAWVMADYVSVGADSDGLRVPLSPGAAQEIADASGMVLPTPKVVDAIWKAAKLRLKPQPISPSAAMITVPVFMEHHGLIEAQLQALDWRAGQLIAGHKKDVVLCQGLSKAVGKVAIYGWHRADGRPIQPLYLGHTHRHVDYSHGVRLLAQEVRVDGRPMDWGEVLADDTLADYLSNEGPLKEGRYRFPKKE